MIIIVVAIAENNAIGKDNKLLCHLPNDLKRFKAMTENQYVIMGRKTFESIGKPLTNRTNIIITRQKDYKQEGCVVVDSIEKAITLCPEDKNCYIIGGGEIYRLAIPYADFLEITRIKNNFEADAFFPKIDLSQWRLANVDVYRKDENHPYDYNFETYTDNIELYNQN